MISMASWSWHPRCGTSPLVLPNIQLSQPSSAACRTLRKDLGGLLQCIVPHVSSPAGSDSKPAGVE